jgi:hypothetical protein
LIRVAAAWSVSAPSTSVQAGRVHHHVRPATAARTRPRSVDIQLGTGGRGQLDRGSAQQHIDQVVAEHRPRPR